jgi:hypothetical protein
LLFSRIALKASEDACAPVILQLYPHGILIAPQIFA